jgi:hypothetical protein
MLETSATPYAPGKGDRAPLRAGNLTRGERETRKRRGHEPPQLTAPVRGMLFTSQSVLRCLAPPAQGLPGKAQGVFIHSSRALHSAR